MSAGQNYLKVVYNESRTPKTEYPRQLIEYLVKRFALRQSDTLLEPGCGRGDFLLEFKRAGLTCFGLDREPESFDGHREIEVRHCDLAKDAFPFDDGSLDVVYHKSMLEHLYDPSLLMTETYRVLKPGGKLIILTPDWHSQYLNFFEDFTHCRPYDVTSLADLMAIFRFQDVSAERFHQLPFVWRHSWCKVLTALLRVFFSAHSARNWSRVLRIKSLRWSVELMILGFGRKPGNA